MIADEILDVIKCFLLLQANAPQCGQSGAIALPSELSILPLDIQYHADFSYRSQI